jgi:ubiquinone/menaquinone biosynthesis C-methylase UbiE
MKWTNKSTANEGYTGIWNSAFNYLNFLNDKTNNLRAVNLLFDTIELPTGNNLNVLDLGCGMAWTSALLKQKFDHKIRKIDLFDADESFENHSENMFKIFDVDFKNVKFIKGNFDELNALDEKYDIIMMTSAIHHSYDLYNLVSDIRGLLSDRGILLILNENPVPHLKFTWFLIKNYLHDFLLHLFKPRYSIFKQISHCGIKYDPILGDYLIPLNRYVYLFDLLDLDYRLFDTRLKQYLEIATDHTLKHFICYKKEY